MLADFLKNIVYELNAKILLQAKGNETEEESGHKRRSPTRWQIHANEMGVPRKATNKNA